MSAKLNSMDCETLGCTIYQNLFSISHFMPEQAEF